MATQPTFRYFELRLKLLTEQLGTCPEASIYSKHVQEKAKKEIATANRLAGKLTKSLEKYAGVEFTDEKAVKELQGILRAYMQSTGIKHHLSDDAEKLAEQAAQIRDEWEAMSGKSAGSAPTIFMRDEEGHAVISGHMILGNVKENLRIITNNGDKQIAKSKVAVGEMGALDFKVVEPFVRPSNDVAKDEDGKPILLERPIRFDRMGKTETAICRSEYLPAGTEYTCTLRMRAASPLCQPENLDKLLDLGKSNGLGQWRGSGNKGAFCFQLKELKDFKEPAVPAGWK